MQKYPMIKYCSIALCILLVCSELTSSAPYNTGDYEGNNVRDLIQYLLQKEAMEDQLNLQPHQVVRKSNRSPSLRLRFGKRSDSSYEPNPQHFVHPNHLMEELAEN